ncbi:MAG: type II toxin-antitoxin system RelE/ParE family toxin [Rickettsiales bacterium]|nr:type II toxin-antitoxin system RelE/ParE family toxin [Rickettsiales bacterium]
MSDHQYDIEIFTTTQGKEPFSDWFESFDRNIKKRIILRIDRIKNGNLGDYKNIGDGVFKFKFDFGSGYRIYFGKDNKKLIILLCGGDKKTQKQDIKKAKQYWLEYNHQLQ